MDSFIELRSQPCRRRIAPESSDAQPIQAKWTSVHAALQRRAEWMGYLFLGRMLIPGSERSVALPRGASAGGSEPFQGSE